MKEQWKDVIGYEGLYEISNFGRLKSLAKTWIGHNGGIHKKSETFMKLNVDGCGYYVTILCDVGTTKTTKIHHLVWEHFGDTKRNGSIIQIDHIDGNKINNNINNLQLLSCRENISKHHRNKKCSSKYTGVYYDDRCKKKKWKAQIGIKMKRVFLGRFNTENEAHLAYQKALAML